MKVKKITLPNNCLQILKETRRHYEKIEKGAGFTDDRGLNHSGEDIYHNTLEVFKYLFSEEIQEMIGIAELVKTAEKKGI